MMLSLFSSLQQSFNDSIICKDDDKWEAAILDEYAEDLDSGDEEEVTSYLKEKYDRKGTIADGAAPSTVSQNPTKRRRHRQGSASRSAAPTRRTRTTDENRTRDQSLRQPLKRCRSSATAKLKKLYRQKSKEEKPYFDWEAYRIKQTGIASSSLPPLSQKTPIVGLHHPRKHPSIRTNGDQLTRLLA